MSAYLSGHQMNLPAVPVPWRSAPHGRSPARRSVHRLWTTEHPPALTVTDGDTVTFEVQEALAGQFDNLRTGDPLPELDWDRVYPLAGPIMVDGAQPGDALEIEIVEVVPG